MRSQWSVILIFVILIGLVSYSTSFQNAAWWNKYFNADNLAISRLINDEKSSVTLCYECTKGMEFGNITSLSYHLRDRSKIQILKEFNPNKIPNDVEAIFLFNPPPTFQEEIKNRSDLKLENIYHNHLSLWKIQQ